MSNKNLQVGNPEDFLGELEEMDLSELKDKMFGVAVSTGKRDKAMFICSTLRAPLNFFEMVEQVSNFWTQQQLHAKAFIISKDKSPKYLDMCTIDFIEARCNDILMDGLLSGALEESKEFTCKAGFIPEEDSSEQTSKQDTST